jgi:glycosyltransferase involved in cell wall biosynthesis
MKPRILYAGNFDIRSVDDRCQQGSNPTHHLHAVPDLRQRGYEVDVFGIPPGTEANVWAFQVALMRSARGYDAIVAHNLYEVNALAALRWVGLFRVPIVAFVHSISERSVQKFTARGADRLLVLNDRAMAVLRGAGVPEAKLRKFDFGADLGFYKPITVPTEFILSVGVSERDHATLIEAARFNGLPVVIVGKLDAAMQAGLPPNVTVMSQGQYDLSFERLLDLYNRARLVVVNHHGSDHPFGLNGVVEAMAMAKPVILTQGLGIDINPQAQGFGRTVPAGSAHALAQAMTELFQADPAQLQLWGARARQLADTTYNTHRMADDLVAALQR